jgi:preprotein translocase subunit SecG
MPILLMALLALLVFGVIGILLTVAVLLEHSKRGSYAKGAAGHAVASGEAQSLNHPPFNYPLR